MHMASAKKTRPPHASRGLDGPAGATGWGAGRAGWVVSGASVAGAGTGVGAGSGAGALLGAVLERSGLGAIDFSGIFGGGLMVSGAGTGIGTGSDIAAGAGTGSGIGGGAGAGAGAATGLGAGVATLAPGLPESPTYQ